MSETEGSRQSIERVQPYPHVVMTVRPLKLPDELLALDPEARVWWDHGTRCGGARSDLLPVHEVIEQFRTTMQRQWFGKFRLDETADLIAEARGLDPKELLETMKLAFKSGDLVVRDAESRLKKSPSHRNASGKDLVYVAEVDEWLMAQDVGYSFPKIIVGRVRPLKAGGNDAAEISAAGRSTLAEDRFDMLATRQQLVDAFGRFVGMDLSWFKSLKDTPALEAARKIKGRPGRSGYRSEPMFCPYEVMLYVTAAGKRVRRPLPQEKAWSLLERHFPKVYEANQIGDPRPIE